MRKKFTLLFFIMIFSFFSVFAAETTAEEVTTITITNARQTSYKKAEETGNDVIVLEGAVELSVQKGSSVSNIKADTVTYDRKTEMLYAEGSVVIETKDGNSGGETTNAKSLLLNTSTMEGIFDGGKIVQTQSDALNLPSGSTLIVFSDLFGKGSENTISFKNSSLTFCDDENPHWKINATRTWLLPGGEFAFFNALLYVGSVPVIYLPAFYYPKDELIFNPVFNYTKRGGYSVQTTTYLYGRKPLESNSTETKKEDSSGSANAADSIKGLYNFIKPTTLKEQKREGLILHNLNDDYKGDTSQFVKVMADWYSNLGYMVGLNMNLQPKNKAISKIAFGADIGITNTVFRIDQNYYPFSESGRTYNDTSNFLGLELPFRYSGNLEFVLAKPFRISLSLPIYSDPFYANDFKNSRFETMDWISYMLDNTTLGSKEPEEPVITEVTSYTWQLSSSISPKIPGILTPYLSSASVNLSSSVNISSMSADSSVLTYKGSDDYDLSWTFNTPLRKFYYPSLVTPVSANVSMSGTIFSWPPVEKASSAKKSYNYPITMNMPDALKSEKQLQEEAERAAAEQENGNKENQNTKKEDETNGEKENLFEYTLPDLAFSAPRENVSKGLDYKLTYSMNTNITTQLSYSSANLKSSEDFDWEKIRASMYTIKAPLTVTSNLSYGGDFFSMTNGISYSPLYQKHPYISYDEEIGYTPSAANTLILSDYNAEKQDIVNNNTITFKPFTQFGVISDTSFSWNTNIKTLRRKFIGDVDNPEWDVLTVDWDDENCITVNSLSQAFSAKEYDNKLKQTLTFTEVLPPLIKEYTAALSLVFPYVTANVSTGIKEVRANANTAATETEEVKEWEKSPLNQSLNISFPVLSKNLSLSQAYTYNMENEEHESLKFSGSWNGMSASYLISNTYGYDFDNGWKIREEKEFLPYSFSFSYNSGSKTYYRWFNRIAVSPGINTSVVADLIRPTNTYLLFTPSLTFNITEFMNLTFSATSRNSVLYWYFHNEENDLYSEWGGFPGNVISDLIDSFRFDDKAKREGSGFKLKSLNMSLSHELHDWKFNLTLKIEPRLIVENGKKMYDFSPYMTLGVVWNPMESMKTSIIDDYGEWKIE